MHRPQALLVMRHGTFLDQFGSAEMGRLRDAAELGDPVWAEDFATPATRARLAETEVLFTSWGSPRLDAATLADAPRLRAVFHCAGTVRPVVSEALWSRGILVTSAAEANATPVAEYTLAAIIFAGKKAHVLAGQARVGLLGRHGVGDREDLSNYGRVIGIVGFSRVGRQLMHRLRLLETGGVLVADPYADPAAVAEAGGRLVGLDELLTRAEILSLHLPELPETRHTIAARELALLPDGATVINTARGSVIDTEALARECAAGRLNAILDVTDPEPLPPDSPLYSLPNVMITPHIAGSLGTETRRMSALALTELDRYVRGEAPLHPVTRAAMEVSA